MIDPERATVALVAIDDVVLERLVNAATSDAAADEVTPRLTAVEGWTAERVAWLRALHRDCRAGLDGPAAEATWAVVVNDTIIGSVRLKRTDESVVLETGIWLTRSARGRGLGRKAMIATLHKARSFQATGVRAHTTAENVAALAVLESLGFSVTPSADGQRAAQLDLGEVADPATDAAAGPAA